jgi:hypothetical protein
MASTTEQRRLGVLRPVGVIRAGPQSFCQVLSASVCLRTLHLEVAYE